MLNLSNKLTSSELHSAIIGNPLIVTPDTTVMAAIAQMSGIRVICSPTKITDGQLDQPHLDARSSCVLVVEDGQLIGILTERDVVCLIAQNCHLEDLIIKDVMISPVVTLQLSAFTNLFTAINLLQQYHISHIPILDDQNQVMGLVTDESLRQTSHLINLLRLRESEQQAQIALRERQQVEQELQQLNQELERRVEERSAALHISETTNKAIVEAIPDLLLRLKRDGTCLDYIKPAINAENFLAITAHICEILPPELLQKQLEMIEKAIATGELQVYEHQFLKHDRMNYEEVRILALNDTEVLVIVRDITEKQILLDQRQKTEAFLLKSEQRYRALMDNASDAIFLADPQGNLIETNQKAEILSGYTREELTHLHISQIHPPEALEAVRNHFRNIIENNFASPVESIVLRKDGSHIPVEITGSLIELDGEQIAQGIFRDISERVRLEAERQQSEAKLIYTNQKLARATRLKDEFLANMSHELRTPLNAILGMSEGLIEEIFGPLNERQIKALNTIQRSGNHLLELINDILDVAKIEAGQIELKYTSVSLSDLCRSSLAFIEQQALKKRIQLEAKIPVNLPNLLLDERRIRQVLINLLNNAVKFTPEGGHITLEVTQPAINPANLKPYLEIVITDTGIGIAPENISKLFQPFIQIDSALNRQYAGTGLGLALVKQIVEIHGGKVGLTSELGVGSCFKIELPCTPFSSADNHEQLAITSELQYPPVQELASPTPLILLVEDNEANISMLSPYLEAKGYKILLAQDGEEAINMAITHHPDLILMDIQMPGMDGIEAMRQIRLDPNLVNVPIIVLTALVMTGDRHRCLQAGANEYLAKPMKLKQLTATIQEFLNK